MSGRAGDVCDPSTGARAPWRDRPVESAPRPVRPGGARPQTACSGSSNWSRGLQCRGRRLHQHGRSSRFQDDHPGDGGSLVSGHFWHSGWSVMQPFRGCITYSKQQIGSATIGIETFDLELSYWGIESLTVSAGRFAPRSLDTRTRCGRPSPLTGIHSFLSPPFCDKGCRSRNDSMMAATSSGFSNDAKCTASKMCTSALGASRR
jgi:hypothetical protein